jgi:excinuclease ABC subunit A
MSKDLLKIINAKENNLKNVTLNLPHDTFITLTGVSGSGKSTLAFDTVYAEGQRRYVETFSPYTRQFFDKVKKPEVDAVLGVRPSIALQQKTRIFNSRSTVGSLTDCNDYLKIIWSHFAKAHCPDCGIYLRGYTPSELADRLMNMASLKEGKTFLICGALQVTKKNIEGEIFRLNTLGYSRMFDEESGAVHSMSDLDTKKFIKKRSMLYIVFDRIKDVKKNAKNEQHNTLRKRIIDSIEQAYTFSSSVCTVIELPLPDAASSRKPFLSAITANRSFNRSSTLYRLFRYARSPLCEVQDLKLLKPIPNLFSFNHPTGACPDCRGFGNKLEVDLKLCIPDESKTVKEEAIVCWKGDTLKHEYNALLKFCVANDISIDTPWRRLKATDKEKLLSAKTKEFWGIYPWFEWFEKKTYKMHIRIFLSRFRSPVACSGCHGTRLRRDALTYRIQGLHIAQVQAMQIKNLLSWLVAFKASVNVPKDLENVFIRLLTRLEALAHLGLSYLTLDRLARTLSGGETQRVNLTSALGSELVSTHFVLDEPSVGLHAKDTDALTAELRKLQRRGNSLLVVEHDPEVIKASDHVVEIGPLAGEKGGEVLYSDDAKNWNGTSIEIEKEKLLQGRKTGSSEKSIEIKNAAVRNLKGFDLILPTEKLTCITGVSGSGKSTLVTEVLPNALKTSSASALHYTLINQSPLAKSPRSNIATYSKIWERVRVLLAETEDARSRALTKSSFSFNVNAGRCTACNGAGFIKEDMQFLSDVYIPCENCLGRRFQDSILEVKFKEKNVDDLLKMTVEEGMTFFAEYEDIISPLSVLKNLGLAHLTLGHPLSELSGGEAQRLKLVPYLSETLTHDRQASQKALLVFDEPTTGLHVKDIYSLIDLFRMLRDLGHTVICVEHNLMLITASDWIVDLGPEGGDEGGFLLQTGTVDDFIKLPKTSTGEYLAKFFQTLSETKKEVDHSKKIGLKTVDFQVKKPKSINIYGARVHNLKNLSLEVPLHKFVALTGVSGSGKSSIAKDIIYAEGQRRYIDCLSPYAQQFIHSLKRPDVERIENITPTICVYQHTFQPSALSTVGTMSEIYNFLRLLYTKTGEQFCTDHPDARITSADHSNFAEMIRSLDTKMVRILAPIIVKKKGSHKEIFKRAVSSEFSEVRVDSIYYKSSYWIEETLEKAKVHSIDFVIGKFNPKKVHYEIIEDSLKQAFALGGGQVMLHYDEHDEIFSSSRSCPVCKKGYFKPDPEDLSFNSIRGKCQKCQGRAVLKDGSVCAVCEGSRLNPIGRNIRLQGLTIYDAASLTPQNLITFVEGLQFTPQKKLMAEAICKEIIAKLQVLIDLGLDYIRLTRDCRSLSGGELQRLRLAAAMGSPLTGVMYIFDEPSAGLHARDTEKVIRQLKKLRDDGNSVVVIEHDPETILATDHIIEIGPGGGREGGTVVYTGKTDTYLKKADTITARCLKEQDFFEEVSSLTPFTSEHALTIIQGKKNNIKSVGGKQPLKIPLQGIVTFTGVSGAGKSSLLHGIIYETLVSGKKSKDTWSYKDCSLQSDLPLDSIKIVDQKPISSTSRSTPASYLGIWDEIRKLFSETVEAKALGKTASFFSYNSGNGKCPHCKGRGRVKLEMSFLAEAETECEICEGKRYTEEALSLHYREHSVSDVLRLTFEEARHFFIHHRKIHPTLRTACEMGLGYLTLGQESTTLSGGESQRIKLVYELSRRYTSHQLYILDEPTTGLHINDISKLIKIFQELNSLGHSIFIIEHDQQIIRNSDYIIELGPGAGEKGGKVTFAGLTTKYEQRHLSQHS